MALPKAYHVSRVTEALQSLAQQVNDASRVALRIRPVSVSDPPAKPGAPLLLPRLDSVDPSSITEGQNQPLTLTVKGKHLKKVESFSLLSAEGLCKPITGGNINVLDSTTFTADVSLNKCRAGLYHALVCKKNGLEASLRNAFEIKSASNGDGRTPPGVTVSAETSRIKLS